MAETATGRKADPATAGISLLLAVWVVNWLTYRAFASPLPYCWAKAWAGPILAQVHDGLRACLFLLVLGAIFTSRLKLLIQLLGFVAFNLMLPGFLDTLFSFGQICR